MEDRKTAIAILICIMLFLVYQELFITPYTRQFQQQLDQPTSSMQPQVAAQSAAPAATIQQLPTPVDASSVVSSYPSPAELKSAGVTRVETKDLVVEISHLGASFLSVKLKQHRAHLGDKDLYEMIKSSEGTPLPPLVYSGNASDNRVVYSLAESNAPAQVANQYFVTSKKPLTLTFGGTLSDGRKITKMLSFNESGFVVDVDVATEVPAADGSRIWIEWPSFEPANAPHASWDFHGYISLIENKLNRMASKDVPAASTVIGNVRWIGLSDKYFFSALMPRGDTAVEARVVRVGDVVSARIPGEPTTGKFSLFVGAKEMHELQAVGHEIHRVVDLGTFSFLAHPLLWLLRFFHTVFANWGLAIVALTLLIKFLFLPLTKKSFASMSAMQELQPQIKEMRERYKGDATKMNQELMALYKRKGVNPMGGCFPIMIQIPVFLGLYNSLQNAIELRHAHYALWIHDLSAPENLEILGFPIPVMVVLMGVLMLVQQWTTPSTMDPSQKKVMLVMTVFLTFMFVGFPAGLVLYWLTNNLISIVQQYYIRKQMVRYEMRATIVASLVIFGFAYVLTLV